MSTQEQDEYIFSCVRHNRLDEVKAWLDAGHSPDMRDPHGNTLLAVACQNGLKSMAKAALRAGGDINTCNDVGNTPLHFCSAFGYGDTLGAYLASKGANTEAQNKWGKTPHDVRANPQFMESGGDAPAAAPAAKSGGMWGFLRGGSKGGSSSSQAAAAAAGGDGGAGASVPGYQSIPAPARPQRGVSTPASAAAYMKVEGHMDDGRSESHRWQLASQMLSEEWPWRTMAAPQPLGLTYLMRCEQVAWRVDDGKRIRWMPYCAGRRKAGQEEESDF